MPYAKDAKKDVEETTERVLSSDEAREYLDMSQSTLYRYVKDGTIPAYKVGGRWKFTVESLDAMLSRDSPSGTQKEKKTLRQIFDVLHREKFPYRPGMIVDIPEKMWVDWQDRTGWRSCVCIARKEQGVLYTQGSASGEDIHWTCTSETAQMIGKIWEQWSSADTERIPHRPGRCDVFRRPDSTRYVLRLARSFHPLAEGTLTDGINSSEIASVFQHTYIQEGCAAERGDWRVIGPAQSITWHVVYYLLHILCKQGGYIPEEVVCSEDEPTLWYTGGTHLYADTPMDESTSGASVFMYGHQLHTAFENRVPRTPEHRICYSYYTGSAVNWRDIWILTPAGHSVRIRGE